MKRTSILDKVKTSKSIIKDIVKHNTYVGKNVLMRQLTKKSNNNLSESSKLKNSSSALFQSNDVDFVRNLNFDYVGQINDNIQLLLYSIF